MYRSSKDFKCLQENERLAVQEIYLHSQRSTCYLSYMVYMQGILNMFKVCLNLSHCLVSVSLRFSCGYLVSQIIFEWYQCREARRIDHLYLEWASLDSSSQSETTKGTQSVPSSSMVKDDDRIQVSDAIKMVHIYKFLQHVFLLGLETSNFF